MPCVVAALRLPAAWRAALPRFAVEWRRIGPRRPSQRTLASSAFSVYILPPSRTCSFDCLALCPNNCLALRCGSNDGMLEESSMKVLWPAACVPASVLNSSSQALPAQRTRRAATVKTQTASDGGVAPRQQTIPAVFEHRPTPAALLKRCTQREQRQNWRWHGAAAV